MLAVRDLSKSFGSRELWSEVSFEVARGQMLALTGPSGAGKSTLLNCIGLLEKPDGGEILVEGTDITRFGRRAQRLFRRDTLGYLFQSYALIENATVKGNLDAAIASGSARRKRRRQYAEALERVGLSEREEEPIYQLSGGEQQRVALARLIVKRATLILADEPTGALDEENERMVMQILRDLADEGACVVVTTHRRSVSERCDSVFKIAGS
ncbi:Arginine transport ATP-binding protein ArtM [Rubrobacter xylanophilus DSM 9941]|uniref:ABC transporter ATP-binding protein n=1 Tax=Rubrobacter xylanophilus TaxID=49319 RepID=UPI001C63CA1F|nr:ATP-binding cassette domain-containing protein [Rubrobacter xylanophilus]QYJ14904.1 Arginine transport ATP-binding protein ArtM [Rubrobacter xylanophilus DSM 9941]